MEGCSEGGPASSGGTYMVRYVSDLVNCPIFRGSDHVGEITLVYLHVDLVDRSKGRNLHVVSISSTPSHGPQVCLKYTVDFILCRRSEVRRRGIYVCILPFGVSALASTREHLDELLKIYGVLPHIFYHASSYLVVLALVAIELVGKGVKKAVT